MRHLMKNLAVVALMLLSLSACKKSNQETPKPKEKMYAMAVHVMAPGSDQQKGILIGTKSYFKKILDGNNRMIPIKRVSNKNFVFSAMIAGGSNTGTIIDRSFWTNPHNNESECMGAIYEFYQAHYPQWQGYANGTCNTLRITIACDALNSDLPEMRTFIIGPHSAKCSVDHKTSSVLLSNILEPFPFSQDDYDSGDVTEYISKMELSNLKM